MKTKQHVLLLLLFVGALFSFQTPRTSLEMDNQTFVNNAAASNSFKLEAGKLATKMANSPEVADFGRNMVESHTRVGNDLKKLAARKNWEVPTALPADKERDLEQLRSVSESDFDVAFMKLMVTSHTEAVDLFSRASGADGVADMDLKAFAAQHLPDLQTHLQMARKLESITD